MSGCTIVNCQRQHCPGLARALTLVALEGKYLSRNTPFSQNEIELFHEYCQQQGFPQLVVLDDAGEVVGWCDIVTREDYPARIGFIGVGLLPEYRGRGIGGEAMQAAMALARQCGFDEIRLDCRVSNIRAIALYRKLGFRKIALRRGRLLIDGENVPIITMKKRI